MALRKEITDQIRELLRQHPNGLSITAIVRQIPINRNTAGRYLESMMVSGQVEMRHFGMAKIYRLAQRVPLSAMLSISSEMIMLLDSHRRIIYANEPMLRFLKTTQKDLYGRNIDYTPCVTLFDDTFDLLKKKVQNGIAGKEWSGELSLQNGAVVFSCRIAPAVFEEGQHGVSVLLEDITERKGAEQRIANSERKFRMLAENSLDIIARHAPDGTCLYITPACLSVFGYRPEEMTGHTSFDLLHHDDLPVVTDVLQRLTRKNPAATAIYRIRHKDGHYVWVESSIRALFDEETGQMTEIYAVTRDVTDRILAEEALREGEDRYRKLVEISPDAVFLHRDGRIIYMNPAAVTLLGARRSDELIGRSVLDIVHPNYQNMVRASIDKDLAGHITPPLELSLIRLDGTQVLVEGRGVRTFIDGQPAVQVAIRDITERKKAEEALRESEGKYRSLAEASPDFIFIIDRDDRVRYVNSHAAALFRVRADQILNKPRSSLFQGEEAQQQAERLRKVFETGMPLRSEGAMPLGSEMHWFDHYLVPITDSGGQITSVLGISRDITTRRCAEKALQESEATARALISAPTDVIILLDREGVILDLNETAVKSLRKKREELVGVLSDTVLPPDIAQARRQRIEKILTTKEAIRFVDERGGIWFDNVVYPILDAEGEVIRIAVIARDITEQKKAQTALLESEARFRDLITTTADIVWQTDEQARFIYLSPQVEGILGYRPEDLIGKAPLDFMEPSIVESNRQAFQKAVKNPPGLVSHESRWLHKDGHTVILETRARPVFRHDGSFGGFRGIDRDITRRKNAEAALHDTIQTFQMLADNSVDIISRFGPDGTCLYTSAASKQLLGCDPKSLIGTDALDRIHPKDRVMVQEVMDAFESGRIETETVVFRLRHNDGRYIRFETTIRAIRDKETGRIREYYTVSRDITARKRG